MPDFCYTVHTRGAAAGFQQTIPAREGKRTAIAFVDIGNVGGFPASSYLTFKSGDVVVYEWDLSTAGNPFLIRDFTTPFAGQVGEQMVITVPAAVGAVLTELTVGYLHLDD